MTTLDLSSRLQRRGLELPAVPKPTGNYRAAKRAGNLVFTSGQTARINGVRHYVGKVGADVTDEDAYHSARLSFLNCLASAAWAAGGLEHVRDVIAITGYVNCVDGYEKQPAAINGASDLVEKLFGEAGAHARTAVGVNALPFNVSVELSVVFEVE